MVASALRTIEWMEDLGFHLIKVSLKASDVLRTVEAYRLFSEKSDYPLHLGVTEAGRGSGAVVKSSIGIGLLLQRRDRRYSPGFLDRRSCGGGPCGL